LFRDFHKWKGKRHRPGMPRTASIEGNFSIIEEIIREDNTGRNFWETWDQPRSVPIGIHKDLQFKNF